MSQSYRSHEHDQPTGTRRSSSHISKTLCQSPPRIVKHPISLPPISTTPITIHPMLRSSIIPSIVYDLNSPPTTIALDPYLAKGAENQYQGWLHDPAAFPADICSLTIRIVGVERPVVVLAATNTYTGVITVGDVLYACHRAWRQAKVEILYPNTPTSTTVSTAYHLLSSPSGPNGRILFSSDLYYRQYRDRMTTGNQMNTGASLSNQCYFQHLSYWNGLMPSEVEPEVWMLRPSPPFRRR